MSYPRPKRYLDYLLRPFARPEYFTALRDVSLSVECGECVALLGPNGAGKTTLLRLIGGLLFPTTGTIAVNGFDSCKSNDKVRSMVGYVLNEERSFFWRLTGRQNLEFFGVLDNLWGKRLQHRILALLELVGLENAADKRVSDYSSGMRQRLAIARGLLADPPILLLDEPTRCLDPAGAQAVRELISRDVHRGQGKTLLIATHNVAEANELCGRVCILEAGRLSVDTATHDARVLQGTLERFYHMVTTGRQPVVSGVE